ncbi:MAG: T9SS type A sorting domain-containing protein, partial [Methanobacterium sp.]
VIYPNPNSGQFTVVCPDNNVFTVEVFDNTGRNIFSKSNVTTKIDIDLKREGSGIYLIKATSKDMILLRKVIIQ